MNFIKVQATACEKYTFMCRSLALFFCILLVHIRTPAFQNTNSDIKKLTKFQMKRLESTVASENKREPLELRKQDYKYQGRWRGSSDGIHIPVYLFEIDSRQQTSLGSIDIFLSTRRLCTLRLRILQWSLTTQS